MILHRIFRAVHTSSCLQDASKSVLFKLRKKTGYAFVNCKKALELHENDVEKAEAWLKEQAQQHGWDQAAKLSTRSTLQGLIALTSNGRHGAIAEINCETDFVARNDKFHRLAELVLNALMQQAAEIKNPEQFNKIHVPGEVLKTLAAGDGKNLADHAALAIGNVGENIQLRRGLCIGVPENVQLFGCTHPAPMNPVPMSVGKYAAFVALRSPRECQELGTQLCQHIIGMNPTKVGNVHEDTPQMDIEEETILIYQEFLLDPLTSVQELLANEEVEIVDFVRVELGGSEEAQQPLDTAQSCN